MGDGKVEYSGGPSSVQLTLRVLHDILETWALSQQDCAISGLKEALNFLS